MLFIGASRQNSTAFTSWSVNSLGTDADEQDLVPTGPHSNGRYPSGADSGRWLIGCGTGVGSR